MSTRPPRLHVLAGVNGAGKSSIGGASLRSFGGEYYNPDEAARALMAAHPALSQVEANGAAGLASPELHIARVRSRVRRGGHDISEQDIRRRYEHSRLNLIHLMPRLAALRVYDNSVEADPAAGKKPAPLLVLHMEKGKILNHRDLARSPEWAKPIVAAALKLGLR